MKLKKIIICLLIVLLRSFNMLSATDAYDTADNKIMLPKYSDELSIENHWQYIGYYLYCLLHENNSFSEATKRKINEAFANNQKIITQFNFAEYEQHIENSGYTLSLGGVNFSNEEVLEGDEEQQTEKANEERTEDGVPLAQGAEGNPPLGEGIEGLPLPTQALPGELPEGFPGATMPSSDIEGGLPVLTPGTTLTFPNGSDTPGELPAYGQMGIQNATLPSGYNSMSDPNMMIQQGSVMGRYNNNMGYGSTGNMPSYNNINAQNYEGANLGNGEQPMYNGQQMYNSGMRAAGGMNGYNNMSDFQAGDQNTGMYQQQQGMYQQQNGMQYNQMGSMSDNQQYGGGMSQEGEGMPQYGQQFGDQPNYQAPSFGNAQMQISDGEMPGELQNQMQPYDEGMVAEQRQMQWQGQSEEQFASEESFQSEESPQLESQEASENTDIDGGYDSQQADTEVMEQRNERNISQEQFEEENSSRGRALEQQQTFSSPQGARQNRSGNVSREEIQPHSQRTVITAPQQEPIPHQGTVFQSQEAKATIPSSQSQPTQQENAEIPTQQTIRQEQSQTFVPSTQQEVTTSIPWSSEVRQPSFVEEMNVPRRSVFDGAEWNPQRGSSSWEVDSNDAPIKFDPNAPLTSADF